MKLSADAAADVCKRSIENGVFVARIEGGLAFTWIRSKTRLYMGCHGGAD